MHWAAQLTRLPLATRMELTLEEEVYNAGLLLDGQGMLPFMLEMRVVLVVHLSMFKDQVTLQDVNVRWDLELD